MTTQMINWFANNQILVKVNDVEYPNIMGTEAKCGWYKNGFTSTIRKGKQGVNEYLQIDIYTVCKGYVDIEERFLFKKKGEDYKIMKWVGWDNVNLLATMKNGTEEWKDMLIAIYQKNK